MSLDHVVVVGASLAGLRACETLRSEGFTGRISLVGDESEMPYDRPPLSKHFLAGTWDADRIRLRKSEEIMGLGLDLRLGVRAVSLDAAARRVRLDDGSHLDADGVVIATGAAPRRLSDQPDLDGVVVLRTLADATGLRVRLQPGSRLVVIGAGFVGLEAAATAVERGCTVTVLEGAPAPLVRGLGSTMGTLVAGVHARHGVDLRCGVSVAGIEGSERVSGVRLGDGSLVPADVVLIGIGVAPATGWLDGSGLEVRDGVVCDATLATSSPGVYAAGDCARWHNQLFDPHDDAEMRVEHWTNAAEQGALAARNMLTVAEGGVPTPYEPVPFFWSDQFDSRIQFVGRAHGGDDVQVFVGDPETGPFAALYGWQGRLRGVLGVSMPKKVMPFRMLLANKASWDEAMAKAATLVG